MFNLCDRWPRRTPGANLKKTDDGKFVLRWKINEFIGNLLFSLSHTNIVVSL